MTNDGDQGDVLRSGITELKNTIARIDNPDRVESQYFQATLVIDTILNKVIPSLSRQKALLEAAFGVEGGNAGFLANAINNTFARMKLDENLAPLNIDTVVVEKRLHYTGFYALETFEGEGDWYSTGFSCIWDFKSEMPVGIEVYLTGVEGLENKTVQLAFAFSTNNFNSNCENTLAEYKRDKTTEIQGMISEDGNSISYTISQPNNTTFFTDIVCNRIGNMRIGEGVCSMWAVKTTNINYL